MDSSPKLEMWALGWLAAKSRAGEDGRPQSGAYPPWVLWEQACWTGTNGRLVGEHVCSCMEGVLSVNPGPRPGQPLVDALEC